MHKFAAVRKIKPRKVSLLLFVGVGILALIDIKLAHTHFAKGFTLFRKDAQSTMVFTFGITFWGFLLALPFSFFPFQGMIFRKRYFLWVPVCMLAMELAYLFAFLFRCVIH
jgi:hypothetical protein